MKSVTFAVTVAVETDQETDAVCQKSRGLKAIDVLMQAVLRPMQIRVGRTSLVRSPDASGHTMHRKSRQDCLYDVPVFSS